MVATMAMRYCGRDFDDADLAEVRRIIDTGPELTRWAISRRVCEVFSWRKPDGGMKEMSCRVALLRMQADGLILLPPPRRRNGNGKGYARRTPGAEPELPLCLPVKELGDLHLELVTTKAASRLWNEYIDRYHYLGYRRMPGAQLRYLARAHDRIVAVLGFAAAAWKVASRDAFIRWTPEQRERNLHLVVNNARFLILPWIRCEHLASKLLALAARRLPGDWQARYGYQPVLLETFVEMPRFTGTCYKAANWVLLGQTQGRGKLDCHHRQTLPIKGVWVYPLDRRFRLRLSQ
jgi:hypothetical protein